MAKVAILTLMDREFMIDSAFGTRIAESKTKFAESLFFVILSGTKWSEESIFLDSSPTAQNDKKNTE
ncbi:hypothetical protein [Helicobacter sp. 23-1045]